MDEKTKKILKKDSLQETEDILGKNWNKFDKSEQLFSIAKAMNDNVEAENHFRSIKDTYHRIPWNEFIELLRQKGFIHAYSYKFKEKEIAIIYYNPQKGWVIFADSYFNGTVINSGHLYAEIKANGEEDMRTIFSWLSTGGLIDQENLIFSTSHDIREGLFSKLEILESAGTFLTKWIEKNKLLWFLDYMDTKVEGYDWKAITQNKIEKCPKELRDIIGR